MSFSSDWLALRAPADAAARDWTLARHFAAALSAAPRITDLGAGTGATVRALKPLLPQAKWTLIDGDAGLLALAPAGCTGHQLDLASDLDAALAGADAITCSALLDLCSADWLDWFAAALAARRLPVYAALSFDGRHGWAPAHPDDAVVDRAFLAHQQRDKGFGPSLGAGAWRHFADALKRHGFRVATSASDWVLGPDQPRLLEAMVSGIADAAAEQAPDQTDAVEAWADARRVAIAGQALHLVVGHQDIVALPPA
ncbi:MAG: class I SAM-dependent methyltransferase [Alphaproteobacteria bacterium]|nr:MAG: class I SAM-dependent methyltransferase [Alphaproteobacteria bacterium]